MKASQSEVDRDQVSEHMHSFVRRLFTGAEVSVIGAARGPAGQLIRKMFFESCGGESLDAFRLPAESSKEYVLRVPLARPYEYSDAGPQRLYACLKRGEMRMAAAFSVEKQFL